MKDKTKYPIYETDQVLRAQHLNQTQYYLEEQIKNTRNQLIGTGISCGLAPGISKGGVLVTKGIGVTSQGYLLGLGQDTLYSAVAEYTLPKAPVYLPFYKGKKQFALWELTDEKEEERKTESIQELGEEFLKDKVVVLFLEIIDEDLKNCIEGDCDNKGSVRHHNTKCLLVSTENLHQLIVANSKDPRSLAFQVTGQHLFNKIVIPRFNVRATYINSSQQIVDDFNKNIQVLEESILSKLTQMTSLYGNLMNLDLDKKFEEVLKSLEASKKDETNSQYIFDYLCDLANNINELGNELTQYSTICANNSDLFPQHLALGELYKVSSVMNWVYRNYWTYAPTTPLTHNKLNAITFYHNKLLSMLTHFGFAPVDQIKIIPSQYAKTKLSNKAIPFYFRSNVRSFNWQHNWKFNNSALGGWNDSTAYYFSENNFLLNDIEDFNFFRVEGHVGKRYQEALSSIQEKIDSFRVPIKLLALSTGHVPIDANPLPDAHFQDLESLFDAAKAELFCGLETTACFVSSLDLDLGQNQNRVTVGVAAAAETSFEEANFGKAETAFNVNSGHSATYKANATRLIYEYKAFTIKYTKGQFLTSKCKIKDETIGSLYLSIINNNAYKDKRLLDLVQASLRNTNVSTQKLLILLLVVLDEIEELVALIKPASLSNLKFDQLKEFLIDFRNFLDYFVEQINAVQDQSAGNLPAYFSELAVRLKNLKSICSLKKIVSILNDYRFRTRDLLEEWKFENFVRKHPGIDHKGGTTKGGTFIIVFHSEEDDQELELLTLDDITVANPTNLVRYVSASKGYSSRMAATGIVAKQQETVVSKEQIENNVYEVARKAGYKISPSIAKRLKDLVGDITTKDDEDERRTLEGVILFDFFLPYVCCGSSGVNVLLPEPKVSISLIDRQFCKNDETKYAFVLSPEGGQITGPGLIEEEGSFFFMPAAEDVEAGKVQFSYVVQGRTATFVAQVFEAPVADFDFNLDSGPNGTYVQFINKSENATAYEWSFGDETGAGSTEESPNHFYNISMESAVVSLTAKNGICQPSVSIKTLELFEPQYSLAIGKNKEFCENDDAAIPVRIQIQNRGDETFPFKGEVVGAGIELPNSKNGNNFTFNPKKAGVGTHKISYVIDKVEVAELNINVQKALVVDFKASVVKVSTTEFFVDMSDIQPKDADIYTWYLDPSNPTIPTAKSDNSGFTYSIPFANVSNQTSVEVKLLANKFPCHAELTKNITVPDRQGGGGNNTSNNFDVNLVNTRIGTINTELGKFDSKSMVTLFGSKGAQVVEDIKGLISNLDATLNSKTNVKKLLDGTLNSDLATKYNSLSQAILAIVPKTTGRVVTKANSAKTTAQNIYSQLYKSFLDVVFVQNNDLSTSDPLYKLYRNFNNQLLAVIADGLSTTEHNEIKVLNQEAALVSTKPNASALANSLKKQL